MLSCPNCSFLFESLLKESSPIESPQGDDSSSDMGESQDLDADAEVEGKSDEVKMERKHEEEEDEEEDDEEDEEEEEDEGGEENEIEMQRKGEGEASQQSKGEESMRHSELGRQGKSGGVQTHSQEHDEETAGDQKQTHKVLTYMYDYDIIPIPVYHGYMRTCTYKDNIHI